jgi:hypothetical protein
MRTLPGLSYGGRSLAYGGRTLAEQYQHWTNWSVPAPAPAAPEPEGLRRIDGGWAVIVNGSVRARFRGVGSKRRALAMVKDAGC